MNLIPPINIQDAEVFEDIRGTAQAFTISLLAGTDDCVKVLDADGNLTFMSCNGMRAMEIDDFEALRGAPWPNLWPEENRALVAKAVEEARNGNSAEFEATCPTAKGAHRVWAVTVIPVMNDSGTVERIMASSRDITERVTLAEDLHRKKDEAEKRLAEVEALLAERDHLIAEMDHRVKNSLSLVSTMMRMQQRDLQDEAAVSALDAAAMRVMAVARVHEGLQERKQDRTVDASDYVRKLMDDLCSVMGNDNRVSLSLAPGLMVAGAKASHLGLIAVELVQNAIKHNPDREVLVSVSLDRVGEEEATLSVTDAGAGLPDGFDLMRDGGLGLTVCVSGASMLGGELTAENRDDGTCFSVRFDTGVGAPA
ncbi:sensor histidine kinase [Pseudaestuariivita atlantica]|uniref:histidine kinase n=1 Tax=Pseudaestuariivita atlantica TaxID=1317121 RepID=A0A0L1JU28_9RHOB|nr:histidine kinase dimerization/phosphoacceptor domain -containing protein [Pseudaestuariivita atlantica]KNG95279.1 hypothetical protein ATO11_01185 [Pseudaestuariivita atlantica]